MLTGAALALATLGAQALAPQGQPPLRGVVLIMADDLGWGDLGRPGRRTPHLDAMARGGLSLERFYAAAPVCSPTRGSVLTGRHPSRYGILGANVGHLPREERTLAEHLGERGWATGFFGKWHLGTLTAQAADSNRGGPRGAKHLSPPWEHGFDTSFATEAKVPTWDPMLKPGTDEAYGTAYWTGPEQPVETNLSGDDSRVIVDRVIPFLHEAVAAQRPFLAVVWLHAPHEPVVSGASERAPFVGRSSAEAEYLGVLAALDDQVGRIRSTLRALEVAQDTLLWFCSDNGPEHASGPGSTGGLRGRKRSLYEGGIRVPGQLEWPAGLEAGARSAVPGITSDILPTLAAILNFQLPERPTLDGEDLLAAISHGGRQSPLGFASGGRAAWIDGDWKLVRPAAGADLELYRLGPDPGEGHDLADEQPTRTSLMHAALGRWEAACARSAAGADYP